MRAEQEHNNSRIVASANEGSIKVPVVTVDSTVGNNVIHALKIDVEGFELAVLLGAEETIKMHKPWICVEFNTLLTRVNKLLQWDVHQLLTDWGYIAHRFENALQPSRIVPNDFEFSGYCNLYYSSTGTP